MGKIAFVFPGQGSQTAGMGKELYESHEQAKRIFDEADKKLSFPLTQLIFNGPQEELTKTTNAQPALLTVSTAILEVLKEAGIHPDFTAGHSLGEYSALVASGAIDYSDAVFAVRKRGEFMEAAVPNGQGSMSAVLGMDREKLASVTESVAREGQAVQLANINCPGQIVISGTAEGVQKAGELAKEQGAKRVIPLEVSGPFHSVLMQPAADKFKDTLESIHISEANVPVISNVTANSMTSPHEIKERLIEQLYSPVLWEDSVRTMLDSGVDTFIEIGPGKVLSGLIKKIDRQAKVYAISDQETLEKTLEALRGKTE
ncbi:[acyl-carrier-protein] S-malonyltransferase [Peribacillus deserti]|uniref:Malonyl CoA-acyl carrier protein transacylase n=1 Tax=Peribacillus deserti TaxID=673318 RepID=A0ABS2QGN1_9BACI|nr:ACP S-malonyltransferase [Peribacillus deserti]MBM7692304.1 [acyl-carrier-protein] S-malonyltransferase [Peribacillus deserti]